MTPRRRPKKRCRASPGQDPLVPAGDREAVGALRRSEARYRTLFEEATEGICLAEAQTGTIVDCNRAFSRLLGYDRSELVGMPQRLLHPESECAGGVSRTFAQHRGECAGEVLDARFITRSGAVREVEIKASPMEIGGRPIMHGFFRDVTDERCHARETAMTLALLRLLSAPTETRELVYEFTSLPVLDSRR